MYIKLLLEIALQCAFVILFIRNMKSLFKDDKLAFTAISRYKEGKYVFSLGVALHLILCFIMLLTIKIVYFFDI